MPSALARWADRRINALSGPQPPPAPPAPPGLPYADLHNDVLLWSRDLLAEHAHGHSDLPRLRRGGVGLQVFSVVTQAPLGLNMRWNPTLAPNMVTLLQMAQGRPAATWFGARERALDRARQLEAAAQASLGRLVVAKDRAGLQAALEAPAARRPTAGILALEGGAPFEGRAENADVLFDAGYRVASFAHFVDTALGGSAHGQGKGGLTRAGREVLDAMAPRGWALDLSHASPALVNDALDYWKGAVMFSHTGVQGTCCGPRNLSDAQLRAVAGRGGLAGIAFFEGATCGRDLASAAKAVLYAVKTAGAASVALGSDFDGAVKTPMDASGLPLLAEELSRRGLPSADVEAVMGANARRWFLRHLPA